MREISSSGTGASGYPGRFHAERLHRRLRRGLLRVRDCDLRLQSTYNGQYFIAALETGRIEMDGIRFSSNGWQAGIIALDDGSADIRGSDFFLDPPGVIQPGMYGGGASPWRTRGAISSHSAGCGVFRGAAHPSGAGGPGPHASVGMAHLRRGGHGDADLSRSGVQDFNSPAGGFHRLLV